jgi:hypothetical protein
MLILSEIIHEKSFAKCLEYRVIFINASSPSSFFLFSNQRAYIPDGTEFLGKLENQERIIYVSFCFVTDLSQI